MTTRALLTPEQAATLKAALHAYNTVVTEAGQDYRRASARLEEEYLAALRELDESRYAKSHTALTRKLETALKPVRKEFDRRVREAWMSLAVGTGPLVAWVIDHPQSHWPANTDDVLRALAALADGVTLEDLDTVADTHNWCGVWPQMRQEALEQFPELAA